MSLTQKQRGVLAGMVGAMLLTAGAFVGAWWWASRVSLPPDRLWARLRYAMGFELLMVVSFMAAIGNLARHRFFNAEDIDGSGLTTGSEQAKLYQAVLQNTLEQLVLAFPTHLLWLVLMPLGWLLVAPACAVLFAVGRLLFAVGYAKGAPGRAMGFALTFYPTALMNLTMLYYWLIGW